jgi:hypothetical protein
MCNATANSRDNVAVGNQAAGYWGPPQGGVHTENVTVGNRAFKMMRDARQNAALGSNAMEYFAFGDNNVAIGGQAGRHLSDGTAQQSRANNSVYVGSQSRAAGNDQTNQIVIGHLAIGGGSNTITLGNSDITELRCQVTSISALCDPRYKEDITPADLGICLDAVHELPVHRWQWADFAGAHRDRHVTGFLADEVARIFPKAVSAADEYFVRRDAEGNPVMKTITETVNEGTFDPEAGTWTQTPRQVQREIEDVVFIENAQRVNLTEIVPTLWGAVQLLAQQIEELRGGRVGGPDAAAEPAPAAVEAPQPVAGPPTTPVAAAPPLRQRGGVFTAPPRRRP